jgi:CubicO group peptidase (beta-lactamase class C family)
VTAKPPTADREAGDFAREAGDCAREAGDFAREAGDFAREAGDCARGADEPGEATGHLRSREGVRSPHSEAIDALFRDRDGPGRAGGVLAVVKDGEVVHRRGYGVANIEFDVPFTAQTVLRLGSTTKHLCATCILILENRGELSLEDDVRRFVPELPDYGDVVRLRHLLTMTSGFPDGLNLPLLVGMPAVAPLRRQQILDLQLRQKQLTFPPGALCSYSNTNYNLLSLIVERSSGVTLREFMQKELFLPLGMHSTRLVPYDHEPIPQHATGYLEEAGEIQIGRMPTELCGDGGVDTNLDDMLHWYRNFREDRHFGPDYRRRMEAVGVLRDGTPTEYALGLTVSRHRGLRRVGHAGGMPGFLCDFVVYPEVDLGIVLLWNWMDPTVLEKADAICDIVCPAEIRAAGGDPGAKLRVDDADPVIAPVTGTYACAETGFLAHFDRDERGVVCFVLGYPTHLVRGEDGTYLPAKVAQGFGIRVLEGRGDGPRPPLEIRFGALAPMRFEPVAEDPPGPEDPSAFVGTYHSEALGESCRVRAERGGLQIELASPLRRLLWKELAPIRGDLFAAVIPETPNPTNVSVRFLRDDAGRVTAFEYSLSRVYGIRFERAPEAPR